MHTNVDYAKFSAHCFQSVNNTRSFHPSPPRPQQPPPLLLLSAFRKFLSMTLEKQGSSISLRIPVGHNQPAAGQASCVSKQTLEHGRPVSCAWRVYVDLPATCEVKLVKGVKGFFNQQSKSCDSFGSPFSLFTCRFASKAEWCFCCSTALSGVRSQVSWRPDEGFQKILAWGLTHGTFWHSHNVKKIWS